jgi:hypothetical protein
MLNNFAGDSWMIYTIVVENLTLMHRFLSGRLPFIKRG